jgi:hypothetical protein
VLLASRKCGGSVCSLNKSVLAFILSVCNYEYLCMNCNCNFINILIRQTAIPFLYISVDYSEYIEMNYVLPLKTLC